MTVDANHTSELPNAIGALRVDLAARHTGIEIDRREFPHLRRWANAIIGRLSIAELFAAEVAQFGGMSPEAVGDL